MSILGTDFGLMGVSMQGHMWKVVVFLTSFPIFFTGIIKNLFHERQRTPDS